MLLTYIIALIFIVILLFGAVRLHLSFGFHRVTKTKAKTTVADRVRNANLHDHIFSKY